MTAFSNEELDAVLEALVELREKQEEDGKSRMTFSSDEVKKLIPSLSDKPDGYINELLQKFPSDIKHAAFPLGLWKFL